MQHLYLNRNNSLFTTDQIMAYYKNNISNVYFEFDAFKKKDKTKRHSIIILRIKK